MLEIQEVLRRTEQGVTRPFLCRASNHALYYVKGRNIGVRDLICEWLGANLARSFGLPVADFDILLIPEEIRLYSSLGKLIGGEYAFGSKQTAQAEEFQWSHVERTGVDTRNDLVVFDWWIRNTDRQLSQLGGNPNLLWDTTTSSPVVIDHNQAFDPAFNVSSFLEGHVFRGQIAELFNDAEKRRYYGAKINEALACWEAATQSIPSEWFYLDEEQTLPVGFNVNEALEILKRFDQADFWKVTL